MTEEGAFVDEWMTRFGEKIGAMGEYFESNLGRHTPDPVLRIIQILNKALIEDAEKIEFDLSSAEGLEGITEAVGSLAEATEEFDIEDETVREKITTAIKALSALARKIDNETEGSEFAGIDRLMNALAVKPSN